MAILTFQGKFHITIDEIKDRLKSTFPEVAQATVREKVEGDVTYVEFRPRPGCKG